MLKIRKITIENFRGIKLPLTIDFGKGSTLTSVLVYGRNGTGKSSIVDAWEWLLNSKIESLRKEGVSEKDFPHKSSNGNSCYISCEFDHSVIKSATSTFNKSKITSPVFSGQYDDFKKFCLYPNYLRYADLQAFVFKTKTDKYKYIAKFFGLERFIKVQEDLQTLMHRLNAIIQTNARDLDVDITTINSVIKATSIEANVIVGYINNVAQKHGLDIITNFTEAGKIKIALEKLVEANPITKELVEWKAFQSKLNRFYPLDSIQQECELLEKLFSELKDDEENIKRLILADLYRKSIEIIPKLNDQTRCPVCDLSYTGDLLKHITDKHNALEILNDKKTKYEAKKLFIEGQFQIIIKKIVAIQSENSERILERFKHFFDELIEVHEILPRKIARFKTELNDIDSIDICNDPVVEKIENFINNENLNKQIVSDIILGFEADERSKTLAQDYGNILKIISSYKNYLVNKEKVSFLSRVNTNLSTLFTELTSFLQKEIESNFNAISEDVIACFNALESSNRFIRNPQIKLLAEKDKAVELEIEFVTEKVTPAFKYLSESQVNSFGLAIFLAAVKHFNKEFKFFILDDIVNSFDAYKRPKVSQLIASKFSDCQILLLTHDQVFFDTVQRDFPNWQRYKFISWDFNTGPKLKLAKSYSEQIQESIDNDDSIIAGQVLGRYLEWTFGVVNENLQTPIRYKIENIYTLSEFYDPLVKRFRDKLKLPNKKHALTMLFDEFESGTIFRNYCAHWKNEATPFTSIEIDAIFKKWLEIENIIYCIGCKSYVKLDSSTGAEYVKCNCGSIDLKASSFYTSNADLSS